MSGWNSGGGQHLGGVGRKENSARRQEFSGIMFESRPLKGYNACWSTLNGRAVLTRREQRDNWQLKLDGHRVGTPMRLLADAVSSNEWAIRKGLT